MSSSAMSESNSAIKQIIIERFLLAADASGLNKSEFAKKVGITSPRLSNMRGRKTPPNHVVIYRAIREFGFTADWFYQGSKVGFRDPELARRLTEIEKSGQAAEAPQSLKPPSTKKTRAPRKAKLPDNP